MRFENAYLPAGGYWSSPFCKWQGSFASVHPVAFGADVARKALAARGIDPAGFDAVVLGWTVPSRHVFYGGPWFAGLAGAPHATGAMISQACATSVAAIAHAAAQVETKGSEATLVVATDKTSNGPHLYHPNPAGPGGKGDAEDWVWDNFGEDPWARNSMLETAENVAREAGITREEMDDAGPPPPPPVRGGGGERVPLPRPRRALRGERREAGPRRGPGGRGRVPHHEGGSRAAEARPARGPDHLRHPDLPGGRHGGVRGRHPRTGAGPGGGAAGPDPLRGDGPGGEGPHGQGRGPRRRAGRSSGRGSGSGTRRGQDPQPLRRERPLLRARDGHRPRGLQPDRLLPGLRPPPGPDRRPADRRGGGGGPRKGGGYVLFAGCAAGDTAAAMVLRVG